MYVTRHNDFAPLAPWSAHWNEMASGVPFRQWEWLEAWWRHYGCNEEGRRLPSHELFVLAVWNDNQDLVGIAPWYRVRSRSGARVIRFLGDGEVCSDYLSVLCPTDEEDSVTGVLADWLNAASQGEAGLKHASRFVGDDSWDRLDFSGVEATDGPVNRLLVHLQARGSVLHYCNIPRSWRIALPDTWDDYLKMLSKPHRNRVRRADRNYFQSGRIALHHTDGECELARCFEVLVDLHQRRWQQRGEPGCFASRRFMAFHREMSARLFVAGQAALSWLELDGRPLAAEYRLRGDAVTYAYQSGIDPDRLDVQPGELANLAAIRHAIEQGQRHYDFLRGDEPYKAHWRAQPRPLIAVRVVPPRTVARLRHSAWLAGQNLKRWIKNSGVLSLGSQSESIATPGTSQVADRTETCQPL